MDRMEELIEKFNTQMTQIQIDLKSCNEKAELILKELAFRKKDTEWSVENYCNNCILIKFTFNERFKYFIKDLGGKWIATRKGWMFSVNQKKSICETLTENFSDWKFTEITD